MKSPLPTNPLTLVVPAGGQASVSFNMCGWLEDIAVQPPAGTFQISITNANGDGRGGTQAGQSGNTTLEVNASCTGLITVTITGSPGTYVITPYGRGYFY